MIAARSVLDNFGIPQSRFGEGLLARTPITGETIATVRTASADDVKTQVQDACKAFLKWRCVPAPKRGELVLLFAEELRRAKMELGSLVTLETGKIVSEGLGEVQEMIDICIFAAGLSRQLYGLTIASERVEHRMMESWHPLGPTAIISAFNFPAAVWCWNAALALVCGNSCIWKPSEKTPLTALAVQALFEKACDRFGSAPNHLSSVLIGGREVGEALASDKRIPLVSATGSTAMGRAIAPKLAQRFARSILELGGNNAAIVCPSADLELTIRAIAFAAMGTAGQRCTTLRRLFAHESIYGRVVGRLKDVFASVAVGDPRQDGVLVGPLIDGNAWDGMREALQEAREQGATVVGGERVETAYPNAFYVRPAIAEIAVQTAVVRKETFAPILYVLPYSILQQAIEQHNDVPQGLASSIFTNDVREAELFLSAVGSDCGIANVNIGPSGAEVGGAFGGEKETGGGRESGSDCWKGYMRRMTSTVNYGSQLPLAQGVRFEI